MVQSHTICVRSAHIESAVVGIVSEFRQKRGHIRRSCRDIRDQECIEIIIDRVAFF